MAEAKEVGIVLGAKDEYQDKLNRFKNDILKKDLKVMDSTAISLCKDNNIPLIVFAMDNPSNIIKAVKGEKIGTLVK